MDEICPIKLPAEQKHLTQILHPEKQLPLRLRSSKFCNCLTLINTYSYLYASIFWRAVRSKLTHWRLWSLSWEKAMICTYLAHFCFRITWFFFFFKCLTLQHLLELVTTLKLENRTHKQRYRFLNGTHLVGEVKNLQEQTQDILNTWS